MKKNQAIIIGIVVILIFGGILGWTALQKGKLPSGGIITPGEEEEEELEEVFNLSATVSQVDTENNFLIVKPTGEEKEIKVVLSDTTQLIKIEYPFDPANPPEDVTSFTAEQTAIDISDFQIGDNVFILTTENIAGKNEFNSVDLIHVLP